MNTVAAQPFDADAFQAATQAGPQAMADIQHFLKLLTEWNARLNLVGPSALSEFWLRHAYDSAQLLQLAPGKKVWADIGAGAGFPGIMLAIMLKNTPDAEVNLIDSMAKRTRFLSEVVTALGLPAIVYTARAEALTLPERVEVVTARACAPLAKLLEFARSMLGSDTTGLFLKGRSAGAEIEDARRQWRFRANLHQSLSDPSGHIVQIQDLRRA